MTHSYLYKHSQEARIHLMKRLIYTMCTFLCTAAYANAQTVIIQAKNPPNTPTAFSWLNSYKKLTLYKFNSSEYCLKVIDQPNSTMQDAMMQNNCSAGVNGGFFSTDIDKSPLGLLIQDGVLISGMETKGFWASGILYDTGRTIRLERRQHLSTPIQDIQQAIQSGPFLVEHGQIVRGLNNTKRDTRTFVATDNAGHWCIGISSALTLQELAEWLASGPKEIGFKINAALNLDGGSSSGYYAKDSQMYIPPIKQVRNYLGIRARN